MTAKTAERRPAGSTEESARQEGQESQPASRPASKPQGKPPRNLWPLMPIALLLFMAATQSVLVYSSLGGLGVEEDYYQKGVDWDAHMAQERTNQELGWQLSVNQSVPRTAGGAAYAELSVQLSDAAGQPIEDAVVHLEAFPNADGDTRFRAQLKPAAGGYATRVPVSQYGLWELRFVVTRGTQRFTHTARQDVVAALVGGR